MPGCSLNLGPDYHTINSMEIGEGIKPDWTPDNRNITSISVQQFSFLRGTLRIDVEGTGLNFYDGDRKIIRWRMKLSEWQVLDHAWSNEAGDKRLIFVEKEADNSFRLMHLDTSDGSITCIYQAEKIIKWPSWSYDNSRIAFIDAANPNGVILINSFDGGDSSVISNVSGWGKVTFARCMAGDPRLLYVANNDGVDNVFLIDIVGGTPTKLTGFNDQATKIYSAEISPDGRMLAFTAQDRQNWPYTHSVVYLQSVAGGEPRPITSSLLSPMDGMYHNWNYLAWSPTGRTLVVESVNECVRDEDWRRSNLENTLFQEFIFQPRQKTLYVISMDKYL
jgi:Tol biopolymer transport system component